MKNVLLIAFYFPPRNHIAGYRTGCFAKYLPENGWLPTVICEDWPAGKPDYDADFVGRIPPEVEIIRIPNPRPQTLYQKVWLRKLMPYWRPSHAPHAWWQAARKQIQELCRRKRFDAIWATYDPLVTLGLAEETAAEWNVPWIADIRDSCNVQPRGSWYKRPLWSWHERQACRKANAVVTVSNDLATGLSRATGRQIEVLENGFDPELFAGKAVPRRNVFSIAYTGNLLYPHQDPKLLLQAVDDCLRTNAIPRSGLELVFYGPSREQIETAWPGAMSSLPIRIFPRISHQEIIAVQRASSVLLLLTFAGQKGVLTGKLFDYLGAGNPILAVPGDNGDVEALLRRTGAGVSAGTVAEISALLKRWYAEWKVKGRIDWVRDEAQVNIYSRRVQTKRLAGMLDRLIAR